MLGDFTFTALINKNKMPMKQNSESIIEELKNCLTLQLQAYYQQDEVLYASLEKKILQLEKHL